MNVKKFFANTSRQALQLVRQGLGPDALILSNRAVEGGMEILAVAREEMHPVRPAAVPPAQEAPATLAPMPAPVAAPAVPQALHHWPTALPHIERDDPAPRPTPVEEAAPRPRAPRNLARATPGQGSAASPAAAPAPSAAPAAPAASEETLRRMFAGEFQSIRGLIEQQMVYQAWDVAQRHDPGKAKVLRGMLHAGFSPALARQFLARMPEGLRDAKKLDWVRSGLDRNLATVAPHDEIVERGGVYALMGPTGVGKTTTVAKIAARCVVRHGADKLALLTTDGYRIGAHEQLRIYGKLLGVRVTAVKDATDLQFALEDLRGKHLVLIDTVGMSQRDQMVQEQMAMLAQAGTDLRRLLLLNAAGNGRTLDDVMRVYGGKQAHGCIITKTDEAVGIATALDVVIRHHMPLHYVTDGQRVPEDLHLPDRAALLDAALAPVTTPSVHQLESQECQLLLAGTAAALETGAALA